MKSFNVDDAPREPVEDLGDRAYTFIVEAKNEYQSTAAFVVVGVGEYTMALSVDVERGQTKESTHDMAVTLAKKAVERLR